MRYATTLQEIKLVNKKSISSGARVFPQSGILNHHENLGSVELVLLAAKRSRELQAEGKRDDCGVAALRNFEENPEIINQTRENLIDSLRNNLPSEEVEGEE